MIKFNEFLSEELVYLNSGVDSDAFLSTKKEVIKKPKSDKYTDEQIDINRIMSKRPDLFAKIYVNRDNMFSMEAVSTKEFLADYDYYFKWFKKLIKSDEGYEYLDFYEIFISSLSDAFGDLVGIKSRKKSQYDELPKFIKDYLELKCKIFKYIQKINERFSYKLDLHSGNFGYARGTKEIKCFDPIHLYYRK